MKTAIVGINWGDEGKGRMVDLLSESFDCIIRYQGGNNAGHTVVNDKGKFILNLLPSGILRDGTVNVMGVGMVIDLEHLNKEMKALSDKGIVITPTQLKISDKATICMPYNKLQDNLEEDRLEGAKFGSTRRGIAPVYGDKYMKKTFRIGDLLHLDTLKDKIKSIVEWKNLTINKGYGAQAIQADEIYNWLVEFGTPIIPFICETGAFLEQQINSGKNLMFEAQLGALRDIDYGIFPYTSSSTTLASYAPIGSGIPFAQLDETIGIMKAYSSCVGEGPFTVEMFGQEATELRDAGGEYGAATGRPRRVGAFDVVASKYGIKVQGATTIALTKLDVLAYMKKIPVCVAYEIDGVVTTEFVTGEELSRAKPIIEYVDGFNCDISKCREKSQLPANAIKYIEYIEKALNAKIKYVSVGASRNDLVTMF